MKDYLNIIDGQFPVRRSESAKAAFREFALREAAAAGWTARVEESESSGGFPGSGKHRNVVIGSPEEARVVFTAHYDTPPRSLVPNLMLPLNRPLKFAVLFLQFLPLLALALGAGAAARSLSGPDGYGGRLVMVGVYLAVYFGLYALLFHGEANRRNRNDNTSGVSAVLALAEKLAGDPRAAFILFDNEEKGKKGSKAYAAAHPETGRNQLVVNLDCVGNGETFIVAAAEKAMDDSRFAALFPALLGIEAKIHPARKASLNSDQKNFTLGVGVCACKYKKGVGYYTPRIHTARDTVASPENIVRLTGALASFVEAL